MWVLGLDTTGTVISTELQTFQPGKLSTGKSSLGEHVAYNIYYANGMLNIVDTRQIMHYNYRVLEESNPTLIYGYTVDDVKVNGGVTYQLLVPAQDRFPLPVGPRDTFCIPWSSVCKIGPDIVLVDIKPEECRVLRGRPKLLF